MFLSSLAESQQEHITLSGVEANMVALLLDYAYTSSITITQANVQVCAYKCMVLLRLPPLPPTRMLQILGIFLSVCVCIILYLIYITSSALCK